MKSMLILIFIFFFSFTFSQKDYKKLSAEQVSKVVTVYDLVKDLPHDCKTYELSFVTSNGLKSIAMNNSDTIAPLIKEFLPSPKKGNKIFVELMANSCLKSKERKFKFIIDED